MTIAILAAVAAWTTAAGQDRPGEPAEPAPEAAATRPSLLTGSLDERSVPVTPPVIVDAQVAPEKPETPLPEDTTVFDLVAALAPPAADGGWWTVKHPKIDQMRLLPCELLETLEEIHAERPDSHFRLSGEVYTYKGDTYLIPRLAVELRAGEKPKPPAKLGPKAKTPPKPPAKDTPAPAKQTPAPPAVATPQPSPTTAPTSDDIAAELLRERPGKPVVPVAVPTTPTVTGPSVAPEGDPIKPGPGRMVADRVVRLTRPPGTDWHLLSFESDNTLREPPVRVLPSERLATMEALVSDKDRKYAGGVFHVSGEIHKYKGWNYIILRHVVRRRDMGQF